MGRRSYGAAYAQNMFVRHHGGGRREVNFSHSRPEIRLRESVVRACVQTRSKTEQIQARKTRKSCSRLADQSKRSLGGA